MSNYLSNIMVTYLFEEKNDGSILTQESLRLMLGPQAELSEDEKIGIFWQTQKIAFNGGVREVIGHDGGDPGAFTFMLFDPIAKVGVVILANGHEGDDADRLLNFIEELFVFAARNHGVRNKE